MSVCIRMRSECERKEREERDRRDGGDKCGEKDDKVQRCCRRVRTSEKMPPERMQKRKQLKDRKRLAYSKHSKTIVMLSLGPATRRVPLRRPPAANASAPNRASAR